MKITKLIPLLVIVVVASYVFMINAFSLYELELKRGGRGYVTDEVWYVSASRVILYKIFGLEPRQAYTYGVTIVFTEKPRDIYYLVNLAKNLNLSIKTDYNKLPAIYINGTENNVKKFIENIKDRYNISDAIPGWMFPDNEGINNYVNWEHPPLGKYLISLCIATLGDSPLYWRIPIVIAGVLTTVIVYIILIKLLKNILVAFIGAVLVITDSMSRAIFTIAILDGYVALFTVISLYFALSRNYHKALFFALLGGLFKATGIFAVIPSIYLLVRNTTIKHGKKPSIFLENLIILSIMSAVLYISLLGIASLPIVYYMGVENWLKYSLLGSIRWHLSTKCTGPGCPTSSAPWEWFLGHNSFSLYVYPDGKVLYAEGFYPLWFASLIMLFTFTPLVYRGYREYGYIALYYYGILVGYITIWILGGRTQYSFYGVHLVPLIYINLVYVVHNAILSEDVSNKVLATWRDLVVKAIDILLGYS